LKTANPFEDDFSSYEVENWEKYVLTREDDHIHLDSSSIGWGCCCLQVTFQAASFYESLKLYDQLIPLTPIFVSLNSKKTRRNKVLSLVRIEYSMSYLERLFK
jgi:hypothetical protein